MNDDEQKIIDDCDIIVWYKVDEDNMNSKYIRAHSNAKRAKKKQLGPKYNIVLFKEDTHTAEKADIFSAIIGDAMGYVENIGKMGYSGLMFREKSHKIAIAKNTIINLLAAFGFSGKEIKEVLKTAK
jgi:hypothetical protein